MENFTKERVIAYIDGYNLYFGLKDSGYNRYKWLNIELLVRNLLKPNQILIKIKYFTTMVTNDSAARQRQKVFVNAINTLSTVEIFYGKFQRENSHCNVCGNDSINDCEKMTDVGIATQLTADAYENYFDMAMLISGDTDLLPPMRFIHNKFKGKRVFVAFPPGRSNDEVRNEAKGSLIIGRKILKDSQFPNNVTNAEGEVFSCPSSWI